MSSRYGWLVRVSPMAVHPRAGGRTTFSDTVSAAETVTGSVLAGRAAMAMLTLRYDLRRAPFADTPLAAVYAACLEQCTWGDEHGFQTVVVSEHHGVDDGYLPSPLAMAAAIAGRTRRIMVNISALLVPLHDPLRLAEDIAVIDLASGGRVSIVARLGHREGEVEMF